MSIVDVLHRQSSPGISWSRVNMAESVVGVQTPLSWTVWDAGSERGFRLGYRDLGLLSNADLTVPGSLDRRFTGIFYGQGACNMDTFMETLAPMPGSGAAAKKGFFASSTGARQSSLGRRLLVRGRLPVVAALLPRRLGRLRRESDAFWRAATAPGALDSVDSARGQLAGALDRFGPALGMQILASTFISIFYGRIQALLADIGRPDLEMKIIGGYGSMQEIRVTIDLWRIARGDGVLDAFLLEHGFHGPSEGELSSHSWREDPTPVVAMLGRFRAMDDDAHPTAAEHHQADERRAAEQQVLTSLSGTRRVRARALLALSRRYIPLRVEAKAAFMQVFDVARASARAIGDRWAAEGKLEAPDDVFYLTVDEVLGALPDDPAAVVAERRATRQRYLGVELPLEWVGMPEPLIAPATDNAQPTSIAALGVSSGTAQGVARVLLEAGDAGDLEPGEVLVCHATDPSWSSYFFVAAAVVIDIGGPLSHGAIIARELGIPCVINTRTGTESISSGDLLRVDGDAGTVEIISRAAAIP